MTGQRIHISSARLRNFLSFYEGTVSFDQGLTVIVGPNGSGKTSIFHALKFALGSNEKESRYSKWSDFVRHGASSAEVEVTLTVDGQDRRLLRKIDRDGIPRAFVDGRRVRAVDLRSLTESLGLEPDNTLVFMPQERINALRDMDPIEVRKLVEEGTGLDVSRDRIVLQETQVTQTRSKLESAIAESKAVEGEIGLLQRDLARLEKKRSLQRAERELDVEVKWASLDDLVIQIEKVKADIESRESGLSQILNESKSVETSLAEAEQERQALESQLEGVQRELGAIDAKINEEERRLSRLEDDTKRKVAEVRQLEQQIASEKRKKEKLKEDLEHASSTKEHYMEEHRALQQAMEEADKERASTEDALAAFSEWNAQRAEAHGVYRTLQAEIQGKDLLARSLRERLHVDKAELESIESKWGHTWSVLEKADEKELTRKKSQFENELASLNESRFRESSLVAQLQKEAEETRIMISETSSRIPDSVKELKQAVTERGVKSMMGPIVESTTCEADCSMALEAVLSRGMAFAFVTSDEADYALLVKLRDKIGAPSPVLLVLDHETPSIPELPTGNGIEGWLWDRLSTSSDTIALLRRALGDIVLTTDGRTAASVAAKSGLSAVSLDGHLVIMQEKTTVSYPKCEPVGLVSTAPLQTRLEKREKELTQAKKKLTELITKIESVTAEREKVMDLLGQVTRWSGTWERRKTLSESIPAMEGRIVETEDRLKELQRELGIAETKLRKLDAVQPPERSRLVGQLSAVRTKMRRLQGELSKADSNIHSTEKDEELKRQELRQLEESTKMLTEHLTSTREELKQSKDAGSTIFESIDGMKSSREETAKVHSSLKQAMTEVRETLRTLSERMTELNLTIRNGRLQVIQAKRQLSAIEHENQDLGSSLAGIPRPSTVRPLETARGELVRIRHLLDDYQDVSESVAHTESKLRERMAGLADSITELKLELNEAESAVKSIREQYQDGMKSALSRVEEEIDRILSSVQFTGKVKFELSSNEGVYGVEFKTKIRGDNYEKLSAGSGGERSLVAIGLILALQRFNPGPVYALDEIDTFLDATNTELVSKLLYDCSRKSQFILFTPAKSTHLLRHADKRIGVVSPNGVEPSVIIEGPSFSDQ